MSNAIVQMVPGPMQAIGPQRFSTEQRRLIFDTCCGGASETEAQVLIAIAEARGLNPLLSECYFVKRWDKDRGVVWAVQASIDAFRIKAEETGDYGGQDAPSFERNDKGDVVSATVRVYRKSVPGRPFAVGVAYWDEYVQRAKDGKPTRFWSNMPRNQLAKCAEALALRKAFPKVLARIYTPDEMQQADNGKDKEAPHDPPTGEAQGPAAKASKGVNTGLFRRFAAEIRKCANGAELGAVAMRIKNAFDAGELTKEQREKLKGIYAEQLAKLAKGEEADRGQATAMQAADDAADDYKDNGPSNE
jgi:phage recombination protein Bet